MILAIARLDPTPKHQSIARSPSRLVTVGFESRFHRPLVTRVRVGVGYDFLQTIHAE